MHDGSICAIKILTYNIGTTCKTYQDNRYLTGLIHFLGLIRSAKALADGLGQINIHFFYPKPVYLAYNYQKTTSSYTIADVTSF